MESREIVQRLWTCLVCCWPWFESQEPHMVLWMPLEVKNPEHSRWGSLDFPIFPKNKINNFKRWVIFCSCILLNLALKFKLSPIYLTAFEERGTLLCNVDLMNLAWGFSVKRTHRNLRCVYSDGLPKFSPSLIFHCFGIVFYWLIFFFSERQSWNLSYIADIGGCLSANWILVKCLCIFLAWR